MINVADILNEFINTGDTKTFHIDELITDNLLKNKIDIFYESLKMYQQIVNSVKELCVLDIQVDLQIELLSDKKQITGVPKSLDELTDLIDDYAMPEIGILLPKRDFWNPKMEMYLCPLPFEINLISGDISCLYEEYRSMEESKGGLDFYKWVSFSYRRTS